MDVSAIIMATLASEFSDLTDVEQVTRVSLRLMLAAMLGGMLGYERERHGKAAGIRTHMLVSMGAALFVLGAVMGGVGDDAVSRVVQGVVTGIGFLGAGTILKSGKLAEVKGLTTAAGVWMTSAVGVCIGLGLQAIAVMATLMMLFILNVIPQILKQLEKHRR